VCNTAAVPAQLPFVAYDIGLDDTDTLETLQEMLAVDRSIGRWASPVGAATVR
jgi:hypothetical protein